MDNQQNSDLSQQMQELKSIFEEFKQFKAQSQQQIEEPDVMIELEIFDRFLAEINAWLDDKITREELLVLVTECEKCEYKQIAFADFVYKRSKKMNYSFCKMLYERFYIFYLDVRRVKNDLLRQFYKTEEEY